MVRTEAEELKTDSLTLLRVLDRHRLPQTLADTVETLRLARRFRGRGFDVAVAHQATTAAGLTWSGIDAPLAVVFHASAVREAQFLRSHAARRRERLRLRALQ